MLPLTRMRVGGGCSPPRVPASPMPWTARPIRWTSEASLVRRLGVAASEDHTIDRPAGYEFWQNYRADFWPGPQLGWLTQEPETGKPLNRPLFSESGEQDLWTFRGSGTAATTPTTYQM